MKKKIILATHNQHKTHEFRTALSEFDIEIISLDDLGYHDEIIENGNTFIENALIKARTIKKLFPYPVISDDSGLSINSLDGFPGIHSARFMEDKSYLEKCSAINQMLKNKEDKTAFFTCIIAYIDDNEEHIFEGQCHGIIIDDYRGQNGFGYDPIFYIPSLKKTFAELSENEKNQISHRGQALLQFKKYLCDN